MFPTSPCIAVLLSSLMVLAGCYGFKQLNCAAISCTSHYRPVCVYEESWLGRTWQTFHNECKMEKQICKKRYLRYAFPGPCRNRPRNYD